MNAGCTNCYAEADMDKRRGRVKWGPNGTRSRTADDYWKQPLKWNREAACLGTFDCGNGDHADCCPQSNRPRVFCASLADVFEDWSGQIVDNKGRQLFHENMGYTHDPEYPAQRDNPCTMADLRADLFRLIDATPNLDWLVLSKRPENIRRMLEARVTYRNNLWLGTSVSDQATADRMIPELLKCRDLTPVLFVSYEPALGPVDFRPYKLNKHRWGQIAEGIELVIVGGESGPSARPCNVDWIRSTIQQCQEAGVACFTKQLGSRVVDAAASDQRKSYPPEQCWPDSVSERHKLGMEFMPLADKKGGDPDEWPEEFKVRELPIAPPQSRHDALRNSASH